MDLSPTHLHLLLNHFPTVGFIIGLTLFVAALYANSDHLKQAALVIFVGVALLTIPTYATGNAAQLAICEGGGEGQPCADTAVSSYLIELHEGAAFVALMLMFVTGGFAWLGLWQYRRTLHLPRWNAAVILLAALATFATVSRAGALGGEIRHPEIRVTQDVAGADAAPRIGRVVGGFIRDTPWAWVAAETLHFIGLSLIIGVLLLINLRTLGVIRTVPFGALDRLLPWAALGFGLNAVTGMLFFAASYGQYANSSTWYWKLGFIVAAGFNTLYFFFDKGWAVEPGALTRPLSRLVAATALGLWVGVLYWGSMLPFLGDAF